MNFLKNDSGCIYEKQLGWNALEEYINSVNPSSIFLLTDTNTLLYCLPIFKSKIKVSADIKILTITNGENFKNLDSCVSLWERLTALAADKKSLFINLGGGVVSDLGGFVATTFNRGIPIINIPTTLLAMVDAAVGGKNGIDFNGIKNKIGTINKPEMVVVDSLFLKTLPTNEIFSGFAEMLKHALIYSEAYWHELKNMNEKSDEKTDTLLWKSILIKSEIVLKDPLEKNSRKALNYGHTLGHAIESYFMVNPSKKSLLHGEAIAIGMILATYISTQICDFNAEKMQMISAEIVRIYKKIEFSSEDISEIIKLMAHDKKNAAGKVNFVLLKDFGDYKLDCSVPNDKIVASFNFYKNL